MIFCDIFLAHVILSIRPSGQISPSAIEWLHRCGPIPWMRDYSEPSVTTFIFHFFGRIFKCMVGFKSEADDELRAFFSGGSGEDIGF